MKNEKTTALKICPRCHKTYHGNPALSRVDNETYIAPIVAQERLLKASVWTRMNRKKS